MKTIFLDTYHYIWPILIIFIIVCFQMMIIANTAQSPTITVGRMNEREVFKKTN